MVRLIARSSVVLKKNLTGQTVGAWQVCADFVVQPVLAHVPIRCDNISIASATPQTSTRMQPSRTQTSIKMRPSRTETSPRRVLARHIMAHWVFFAKPTTGKAFGANVKNNSNSAQHRK